MNMHPEIRKAMPSARRAAREVPATTHIPFVRFLQDGTFTTRNGDLVAVLELKGFIHETADRAAIKAANDTLARLASSFEDNRTAFYSHIIRTKVKLSDTLPPVNGPGFSEDLDHHYRAQLDEDETYQLRHFLTIVRRPYSSGKRLLDAGLRSFRAAASDPATTAARTKNRKALHMATEQAMRDLSVFGARRLTGTEADRSRTLSFLSMLQSGIWQKAPPIWTHLADAVPNGRITFRKDHVHNLSPGGDKDRFAAVFAVNAYPERSKYYMFDELLGERCEFIATQCYSPMDRVSGGTKIRDAKRGMADAGDEAESLQKDLNEARDAVASRAMSIGRHHFTVSVLGDTRDEMEDAATRVNSCLTGADLRTRREDIGLEAAWWAQLPGNFAYQTRSNKRLVSD
jgi:type IV secretion system protein VirB4